MPQFNSDPVPEQAELSPASFDFGNFPMLEEQSRDCMRKLCREVFSLHEREVGCSKGTMHRISLNDSQPFREKCRCLTPADLEDVRQHLQEPKGAEFYFRVSQPLCFAHHSGAL